MKHRKTGRVLFIMLIALAITAFSAAAVFADNDPGNDWVDYKNIMNHEQLPDGIEMVSRLHTVIVHSSDPERDGKQFQAKVTGVTSRNPENAEVKEAELTDCSSDTGTLPDLYYDVFMKYCKKEDIEVNTFDTVLAEVEDSEYTPESVKLTNA